MIFHNSPTCIGLDISERSLKAVELAKTLRNQWKFKALSDIALDKGIIEDGKVIKYDELATAINKLIARPKLGRFNTRYVVACLPETKTFIKMIDMPPMSIPEVGQAIKWEAEHHIPLSIDETYWDWQLVGQVQPGERIPVLIGVAPKNIADTYMTTLNKTNLITVALEIEAEAIVRSLKDDNLNTNNEAIMFIDLGASRTSLCIFDKNSIQFTVSLPISGSKMTENIANNLKLEETEAEKAKLVCGLDPARSDGAVKKVLLPTMEFLAKKIQDTATFYQEHFVNGNSIKKIILCGGGANLKFIENWLSEELSLPVNRGNPWINIKASHPPYKPSVMLSYTTAIGLALRPFKIAYDRS